MSESGGSSSPIKSVIHRIRLFDSPFAYICLFNRVKDYCSHCLRKPENKKLYTCANCEYTRYCDKNCQRLGWKFHKNECRRLKKVFPNLPLSEVLFLSRVIDRVLFLEENGDKYGWQKDRKWAELMSHKEDIRKDENKYAHFLKICDKMATFRKEEMIDQEKFFEIFCKVSVNSHSIHTMGGDEVGMAIDLGVSAYDHSCRPNCSMVFDGIHVCLRPLTPDTDATNVKNSFISYIDIGRSRYQRRKELKSKWYFDCECERCSDPADDILTSIRCVNPKCNEPIMIREDSETCMVACPNCRAICDEEYVGNAQKMMKELPAKFNVDDNIADLQALLDRISKVLHSKNIYLTRLQTAILSISDKLGENLSFLQKQVYENYRMCFPKADRHLGYQLMHLAKAHIEKGERAEAAPYAYEAMNIFEICFGLEHPYYLQTLALWTFLDTNADKTTEQLLSLTDFKSTRPIDLSQFLEHVPGPPVR